VIRRRSAGWRTGRRRDPPEPLGEVISGLAAEVLPAVAEGRIRPMIDSTFDFDRADEAVDRLRSYEAQGKIILKVSGSRRDGGAASTG